MVAKRLKILSFFLIFSGALNVALIATLIYCKAEKSPSFEDQKQIVCSQRGVLDYFQSLSFKELVTILTSKEKVESLCARRDLALASLVAYHHFDLERALLEKPASSHLFFTPEKKSLALFLNLKEEQFDAILKFAYQEKWPLTPKGLFLRLKTKNRGSDETLREAFFKAPQFRKIEALFQKISSSKTKEDLLSLVLESGWETLENFFQRTLDEESLSPQKRREFLLSALLSGSSHAALFLLELDFSFALHQLTEDQVLGVLALLKAPSEQGILFALELLKSDRGDAVWNAAATNLYAYEGRSPALPVDRKEVLLQFSKHKKEDKKTVLALSPPAASRYHTVQEGESLWKISRQYGVKVDEIVQLNDLQNSSLFPGMTLKLP